MPDDLWEELFAAMGCNRDRAVLAIAVSAGVRAGEILGMRGADIDWGNQLIRVTRKGSRAEQWLPVSADAFVITVDPFCQRILISDRRRPCPPA